MKVNKNSKRIRSIQRNMHWTKGINRRDFIRGTMAASLLATLSSCKPSVDENSFEKSSLEPINYSDDSVSLNNFVFSRDQQLDLQAIYMRLFPDDGDGPSANDINVVTYLEWAMTDSKNIEDGDPEFIAQGIDWMNQLANDTYRDDFKNLTKEKQDLLITQTINSDAGKNWVSILTYYLVEAITLDPYYGGNTNQLGWKWLEHQGGFPQPIRGKTYRNFE